VVIQVFSSPPQRPMTSDFEGFSIPDFIHLFSYLNSWERASIFLFECPVLNKGTTGTIFITSLVWRGPWLGIQPGTSRSRSQHYINRLSRRRCTRVISPYFFVLSWCTSGVGLQVLSFIDNRHLGSIHRFQRYPCF